MRDTSGFPARYCINVMVCSSFRRRLPGRESACLDVKHIGKPCTGERYARFDEGGQGFLSPTLRFTSPLTLATRLIGRRGSPWRARGTHMCVPYGGGPRVIPVPVVCGARMRAPYGTSPLAVLVPEKMQVKMRKTGPKASKTAHKGLKGLKRPFIINNE